jgi:hypothetical protein
VSALWGSSAMIFDSMNGGELINPVLHDVNLDPSPYFTIPPNRKLPTASSFLECSGTP